MYVEIITTAGKFVSDKRSKEQLLAEQPGLNFDKAMEEMTDLFKNFKELNYVSFELAGREIFFNPSNIVSVTVVKDA